MIFTALEGRNNKIYVRIDLENAKEDIEYLGLVRKILTRTEFKIYSKAFNKNISESFLIDDTFFPIQFWGDVYVKLNGVIPNLHLRNPHLMYLPNFDRSEFFDWCMNLNLPEQFDIFKEEYLYQPNSVFNALLFKTGRATLATGLGKTLCTYMWCRYIIEHFLPRDNSKKLLIIVPRKMLVTQTKKAFDEFNNGDVPIIVESMFGGSKKVENANVVIGTYQTLSNYDDDFFMDNFYGIVCDELHTAKSYSIKEEIIAKTNANFYLGLTGTFPEENTLDYLNIVAMFGSNIYTKTTKEGIEDGNICPVRISKIVINYEGEHADFSSNLSDMVKNGEITPTEKYREEKAFFGSHQGRVKLIGDLLNGYKDNAVIMLDSVAFCENLVSFLTEYCTDRKVFLIHGKTKDSVRESIKEYMEANDDAILVATSSCLSTGVSINNIHTISFVEGGKSRIRVMQSTGRGLRLHPKKEFLNLFDFQDNMHKCSFKNHNKERNKIYEKEGHPVIEYNVTLK